MSNLHQQRAAIFGHAYRGVMAYQRAFLRKFDDFVARDINSPAARLSDKEILEIADDICEELRILYKLDEETHNAYRKMIKDVLMKGKKR